MATAEKPKYMWIPPPPLPEFYLSKEQAEEKKKARSSSSSSGTDVDNDDDVVVQETKVKLTSEKKTAREEQRQPPVPGDGAYDGAPPAYRYIGVAPPPPAFTSNNVPPLAVYHICRICLRPRSGKYHREHPIPVNGVPPPPGICRRCRVTSVKEASESSELNISDVDEIVKKGRSNDIKLGAIAPFVPDDAIISNKEAKRMHAQRHLRGRCNERHITIFREASTESQRRHRRSKSTRSDIVYRHVRVVDEPEPKQETGTSVSRRPDAEERAARDTEDTKRRMRYERSAEETTIEYAKPARSRSTRSRRTIKSVNIEKVDSAEASQASRATSSSSTSKDAPVEKPAADTIYLKRPDRTESEIRKIAAEEARRYADEVRKNIRPVSEVRRIAHEEVSRYREAERKLEAYPGGFAHGRMMPMPRQIESNTDEPPKMPWKVARQDTTPAEDKVTGPASRAPTVLSVGSTTYGTSPSRTKSEREAWGPQWRRELSLERRRSSETREDKWRADVTEESRSKVSARPSDLARSDKPRSTCDVVPGSNVSVRGSKVQSQAVSETSWPLSEPRRSNHPADDADIEANEAPRQDRRASIDHERDMIERLSVRSKTSATQRDEAVARSPTAVKKSVGERPSSGVEYEYRLHTIRPADKPADFQPRRRTSPRRSENPSYVTLEIWQEVSTDPAQRAREAAMHDRERADAVEWLKSRVHDPKAHVGVDPDGSVRLACSLPHRGSETRRTNPRSLPTALSKILPSSPRRSPRGEERSPRHHEARRSPQPTRASPSRRPEDSSQRSGGHRGGDGGGSRSPEKDIVVEVWGQVQAKDAARIRRQQEEDARAGKEYVIEAWQQVPSERPAARSVRRDSAMGMPPARRRRERRVHQGPSEDSAHVKFASKVEISPTPPGSDESSNAFRRFHDFMGRKTAHQQIDGHFSDETGEDLIAEYERRGRSRSREPARRKAGQVYHSRVGSSRERDSTVRPQPGQRRHDGLRDDALQRAWSESPSRELDDRKKSSVKGGPPYHPDHRPDGSMTTHDGSRTGGSRASGRRR